MSAPDTPAPFTIEDTEGSRKVRQDDFPLAIGGSDADISLNGFDTADPLAYIGLSEGDVFVQPASDEPPVPLACNGTRLQASQWLHDGDVLRLGPVRLAVEMNESETRFVVREAAADGVVLTPPSREPEPVAVATKVRPIAFQPGRGRKSSGDRRGLRASTVLVVLFLATLTAAAAFVFTSRSIVVQVEPPPDRMAIEGGFAVELGGRRLLRPGTYSLVAVKEGFRPLDVPFEVNRDTNQSFRFELERLPGLLEVLAGDVDGAEVLVDGEVVATTPLDAALEIAPGEHEILVRADRHRSFSTVITVEGAGVTQTLEVELVPLWAAVSFASKPAGATVRVGRSTVGRTPLTAQVLEGAHAYELLLAGFEPHRGRLEVTASQAQTVPLVALTPSDGNVVLLAEPDGATVTVDGVYKGRAPLDLRLEPGRPHRVRVSKAGFEPETREVEVRPEETRELRVTLVAQEGEVRVVSWPPDAELYVDGERQEKSNGTWRLAAVAHEIEVRKAGFAPFSTTVTPIPGIPQSIEATLESLQEREIVKTPQVLKTSEGHELRRIEPGRFLMGASRREPGRGANEVLREVELTRAFYLGTREVSNEQFRRFKAEHLSGQVGGRTLDLENHPAVRVTWEQAAEYCNWLSAKEGLPPAYVMGEGRLTLSRPDTTGYRLPTEAEWAWAARFPKGEAGTKFPWGKSMPVARGSGNYADASAKGILPGVLGGYDDDFPSTSPVDSFQPGPTGLYNMGGNVAEWMHDLYAIRPAGSSKVARDPFGPPDGEFHVIRGSSWMHASITELRLTYRDYGDKPRPDVGFRIARYVDE